VNGTREQQFSVYVSGANVARMRQLQVAPPNHLMPLPHSRHPPLQKQMGASCSRRKSASGAAASRWQLPQSAANHATAAQRKTWQREAVHLARDGAEGGEVIAHRPGSSRSLAFEWDDATVDCR
jgi:hypothetical protein